MELPELPYRGISSFRYADHAIFLAREEETEELIDLVAIYRGVLLYGAAGDGKSSLINAGLLPATSRRHLRPERIRVQPRRDGEIVVERIAMNEGGSTRLPSLFADEEDASQRIVMSLPAFEERVRTAPGSHRPLLIFDQFEEIITLFEPVGAVAVQRALVDMLVRLLRDPLAVKLLFVFREDYLGQVKHLLTAVPELIDQALRLTALSADALPTLIQGPFVRHPGRFAHELDPGLADSLCAALTQRFGSADLSLSEVETVALRVWQSDDPFELLQRRGVQGILEDYLGESLDALSPDLRAAAVALLAQMVTSAGTRNVISAEDLVQRVREQDAQVSPDLLAEALDRLESESRLIRRERRHDIYLYEITSEFLVPWINERRQEAHVERERRSDELRREHERLRERRRLRVLGSIAAAMLIFATVVTILALWALSQRTTARNKEAQATSLALTSSSTPLLGSRPDLSLLLAYAGYRAAPLTEARSGVMAALMAVRGTGGESVGILRGGDRGFAGVAFSPDGRELAAASDDGAVRVFDARTNRQLGAALANSTSVFSSAAFSPDGRTIASAHDDGVRLWDARTHKQLATIAPGGSRGSVTGVAFSPDGRTLAFSSSDGVIRLVIARTHRLLRAQLRNDKRASSSKTATAGFSGLAFGPDETLASAGDDGTVRLWDARTHQQRGAPLGHSRNPILGVAFSADGRMLASAGNDGTVRLWSPRTHKQLGSSLVGDRHVVNAVAFSPDGQTLASAGGGGAVWLWDTRTRRQLGLPLGGHKGAVRSVAFSPDGRTLASASADETIRSWDLRVHDLGSVLRGHTTAVNSLAFSRNGRMLASAGEDQTIAVWDTRTHEPLGTPSRLQPGSRPLLPGLRAGGLAFSPDGRILASAINARTIRLRDVQTRKPLGAPLRGHKDLIDSLAFSPDGHTLASAGGDQTIRLWDTRTHRQLGVPFPAVGGPVHSLALSADGLALALVGVDGTIGLWDIRTRKRQGAPFGVVGGFVTSLSFSPDGHKLAASVSDGTIRLWETRTHKQAGAPLRGHGDGLIAFTPDGRTLASAGSGRSIRLWDTRTHKELGKALRGHTSFVASLAFSPDGRSLASASLDRTVRLWKDILWTSDAELQTTVCHLVGKDLTGAEWGQYASGIARRRSCP